MKFFFLLFNWKFQKFSFFNRHADLYATFIILKCLKSEAASKYFPEISTKPEDGIWSVLN